MLNVKPDVVAPGNKVVSLQARAGNYLASAYPDNVVPPSYYEATPLPPPTGPTCG